MPVWNIIQAVNDALRIEMRRDARVVVLGEDVGKFGGVFRATTGLYDEFGPDRVFDTPLAEAGIIGSAVGMALYGLRPVPEIQFADFIYPAYDQIVSELAKMRWRSGGEYPAKMVVRTPVGGGIRGGLYHSQSPESLFIHVAGLKVVCPANPYDAKGLLLASLRDPAEPKEWEAKDPLERWRRYLETRGLWTQELHDQYTQEITDELMTAVKRAAELGNPPVESMFDDVFSDLPPHLQEQKAELMSLPRAKPQHGGH